MSKTRQRFEAKKKAIRKQRADDAYLKAHTFWCQGKRRRRGRLTDCMFEVRFSRAEEGARASCRRCKQVHIYGSPMTSNGPASERWLTVEQHAESVIETESLEEIDLGDGEREVKLVDHAQWCGDRSKPLFACRGVWRGPGDIAWYLSGRRGIWHRCLSSLSAHELAERRWDAN